MDSLVLALMRTLASLRDRKIWALILAPPSRWCSGSPSLSGAGRVRRLAPRPSAHDPAGRLGRRLARPHLAYLGGWMAIFACAYLTASLLAAVLILPLLLKHLANGEYRDVAAGAGQLRRGDRQ